MRQMTPNKVYTVTLPGHRKPVRRRVASGMIRAWVLTAVMTLSMTVTLACAIVMGPTSEDSTNEAILAAYAAIADPVDFYPVVERQVEAPELEDVVPDDAIQLTRSWMQIWYFDPSVDYQAAINQIWETMKNADLTDEQKDETLMLLEYYEEQRNLKLTALGYEDDTHTHIFCADNTWDEICEILHVPYIEYTQAELEKAAAVLYREAGANWCTDEHRYYTGSVMVNRVVSPRFPDTLMEVLKQPNQYGGANCTYYDERCYNIMKDILENGPINDEVIWQAEFTQGKETVMIFDYSANGHSTTYICK